MTDATATPARTRNLSTLRLMAGALILAGMMVATTVVTVATFGRLHDTGSTEYEDAVVPLHALSDARALLAKTDAALARSIGGLNAPATAADAGSETRAALDAIDRAIAGYTIPDPTPEEVQASAALMAGWQAYRTAATSLLGVVADQGAGDAAQQAYAATAQPYGQLEKALDDATNAKADEAAAFDARISDAYGSGVLLVLGVTGVAILVGVAVSWRSARSMLGGVRTVQATLGSLTDKCAAWLQEGLSRLADNDLTFEVTPVTPPIDRYASDEVGQVAAYVNLLRERMVDTIGAYNRARLRLTETIGEVQAAADSVTRTSTDLNDAATQTAAATQQIALTISQVAGGTAEQARSANEVNVAAGDLSTVIDSVGRGASEGAAAVATSMSSVERMRTAMSSADTARAELVPVNERAAAALDGVTTTLRASADGMGRIKAAVDQSAVKVAELGAKGEQIGAIVETIDDIAEQTNLLALNAAIEAARAGEMGKGFAVVADEVRKLAERSGRATKEIAQLIAEVQQGTADAVSAMNAGAAEVDAGLESGARSAASVADIVAATRDRNEGAARVYAAMDEIGSVAVELSRSSEQIAGIVSETAGGTDRMASNAELVTRSISSIAAVSEQNSAAAEQVSAATEEMSAQAEEVVASASTLAEMAARLDALVGRFTLARDGAAPVASVPRAAAGTMPAVSRATARRAA